MTPPIAPEGPYRQAGCVVVGSYPGGALGVLHSDERDAKDQARRLNHAFAQGVSSERAKWEKLKAKIAQRIAHLDGPFKPHTVSYEVVQQFMAELESQEGSQK